MLVTRRADAGRRRTLGRSETHERVCYVAFVTDTSGVLSCTSGGKFRYVPLSRYTLGDTSNEYKDLKSLSEEQLDEIACKWTVPGPLHHVAFYPETSVTPRYFAYGGEQVPLSVWDLPKALEYYAHSSEESVPTSGDAITDDAQKTGEKRRASSGKSGKQRELLPGEVWRAKNLPNDALSLQRHPLIRSISFLTSGDDAAGEAMYERMVVLVGTKDGLVRVYEPSKKPRHTAEWQVVPKGQGSIRVMDVCPTEQAVFIGDTARNLYMVDSRSGRTLFQYKDITGTISSLLVLEVEGAPTRLLGSSLDHLVRLFDLGEPYGPSQRKRGKTLEQFFSGTDNPTAMTIDPLAVPRVEHRTTEDDEDVWANMAVVGKDEEAQAASAKRARHE